MRVQAKGQPLQPIDYRDFKFRVNLKSEKQLLNGETSIIKFMIYFHILTLHLNIIILTLT